MYNRLRLTNCDSLMYETIEKTSRITIASSKEKYMLLVYFTMNQNLTMMYQI